MLAKGLRVLVTAVIDAKNKGPKVSGMDVSAKGVRRKHGVETKPPPEVVLLPPDPLLSDLKLAVNKCFQDLYVVLAKFKVTYAVGFESTKDATKLGAKKIGGARVEVHGDGADLESEFRAADETTSLLHRREAAPSRFDTGQFSFRDAAQ